MQLWGFLGNVNSCFVFVLFVLLRRQLLEDGFQRSNESIKLQREVLFQIIVLVLFYIMGRNKVMGVDFSVEQNCVILIGKVFQVKYKCWLIFENKEVVQGMYILQIIFESNCDGVI